MFEDILDYGKGTFWIEVTCLKCRYLLAVIETEAEEERVKIDWDTHCPNCGNHNEEVLVRGGYR